MEPPSTTTETTSNCPDRTAIAEKIASYQPRQLPDAVAACVLPELRALVARAEPANPDQARQFLVAATRFLSDLASLGPGPLRELLTETNIARWEHAHLQAGGSRQTRRNYGPVLRRLERVSRGLPARLHGRGRARSSIAPYDVTWLAERCRDVAPGSPEAAACVVACAGAGLHPERVVGARLDTGPAGLARVVLDDGCRLVVAPFDDVARLLEGVVIDDEAWQRGRAAISGDGEQLTITRLAKTWVAAVLALPLPFSQLVATFDLTRARIDAVAPHLEAPAFSDVVPLLRGRVHVSIAP